MLSVKLSNDFEFEAEIINENFMGADNSSYLNIRCQLEDISASEIQINITPQNMSCFIILLDEEQIDEIVGYNEIVSVDKVLSMSEQSLNIRLRKVV